jgi:esterase/lipase
MEKVAFISEGLEIKGVLRHSSQGESKVILLCHGEFDDQKSWGDFADKLYSEGFSVLTFDFSGHGESQGKRSLVNLRMWAYNIRDAINMLSSHGYHQFALVGWGSGGSASLLAGAHDKRLSCMVVLSAPIRLVPSIPERIAYGLVSFVAVIKKGLFKKSLTLSRLNELNELQMVTDLKANEDYFSNPDIREYYRSIPVPDSLDSVWMDITQAIEKVKVPVLILHGKEDQIVKEDQSRLLYDSLEGDKQLKLLNRSGHALHLDQEKEAVIELVLNWLKEYLIIKSS